ncbi:gamma-tubulin complex component 2-like isoform X2 [Artemia franciscana]|uniref:Gamma-tubulin complex component n=2 Tax=Artemia franciscana TaxID=6661 RepID=A0AA88L867_ARTSF|nr:hypothetical protein QYM36_010592 [Artemia franciscana]KAK2716066.1 hypothetical protein QYM36_010592 [Artemia franciscana]
MSSETTSIHELSELKKKLKDLSNKQGTSNATPGSKNLSGTLQDQRNLLPTVSQRMVERPFYSLNYPSEPNVEEVAFKILGPVPFESQEHLIVEDLLYVLSGIEGQYIFSEVNNAVRTFTVDETMSPPLRDMVARFLPLCLDFSTVVRFSEDYSRYDNGLVSQALSGGISVLLKDYIVLIAQLETEHIQGSLSMQKLYYHLQPSMSTMTFLSSIAEDISKDNIKGGAILSYLYRRISRMMGNAEAQKLCVFLLETSAKPYFNILKQWTLKGIIKDPYGEFLVDDHDIRNLENAPKNPAYSDDYWEKRYSIREDQMPIFLEKVADMILRTGKYLNVLRQCGKLIPKGNGKDIVYKHTDSTYLENIEEAYSVASKNLLVHLMKEEDLLGRLKSMKQYFFMEAGDFLLQFQELTESELLKNADDIVLIRLEPLLELALRTSSANADPYKDDLRISLLTFDLQTLINKIANAGSSLDQVYQHNPVDRLTLTGFQSFTFNYSVEWPVSLILNRSAIMCYQMIFRHLFFIKYVETLLCRVWVVNKFVRNFSQSTSQAYTAAFALRQRMLSFVQNLEYYITLEVIEVHWNSFLSAISNATNVDDVLQKHTAMLSRILSDGMVIFTEVLATLTKLLNVCEQFSTFMIAQQEPKQISTADTFEETIKKMDLQFSALLVSFIEKVTVVQFEASSEKRSALLDRLNYNSFYDNVIQMSKTTFTSGSLASEDSMKTTG